MLSYLVNKHKGHGIFAQLTALMRFEPILAQASADLHRCSAFSILSEMLPKNWKIKGSSIVFML